MNFVSYFTIISFKTSGYHATQVITKIFCSPLMPSIKAVDLTPKFCSTFIIIIKI